MARQSNCEQRVVCTIGDVEKLDFVAGEFDLVWCSRVIHHHLPDPQPALSEMYRVLKPGGRLFLRESSGTDLKAMTPVKEADAEWWQRMNRAQQQWFQSKFSHRRPSGDEWLEQIRRVGFQHDVFKVLQYTPAGPRAQVTYLHRWTEGMLENDESPEYGDLLPHDDRLVARRLIDCCKELLQQSDETLHRLNLQVSVSTEICAASK